MCVVIRQFDETKLCVYIVSKLTLQLCVCSSVPLNNDNQLSHSSLQRTSV